METIEKKFYVPTIEEFHIGFDYEYKTSCAQSFLDNTREEWVKETFSASCLMDGESEATDISDLIDENRIRVPYLSKEDIEECGWEYNPVSSEKLAHNNHQMRGIYSSDMKDIRGNNFSLFHNIAENWILIWVSSSEHTHTLWDDKLTTMGETVFAGFTTSRGRETLGNI